MIVVNRLWIAVVLIATPAAALHAQETTPPKQGTASTDPEEAARQRILASERWRGVQELFVAWLGVQQVYTPDEIESINADLRARIETMSPAELETFLAEMENRLAVLTSADATDAREWLAQIIRVSRNPERSLGRPLPDVLNMSAAEIRRELDDVQRQRAARNQTQAAFDRQRAAQVQTAQAAQDARRQQLREAQERTSQAATHATHVSPHAQQRTMAPLPRYSPVYTIGPWGTPIRWHPLGGYW